MLLGNFISCEVIIHTEMLGFPPAKAADEELPQAAEEAPEVEEQSAEAEVLWVSADGPATFFFRVLASPGIEITGASRRPFLILSP